MLYGFLFLFSLHGAWERELNTKASDATMQEAFAGMKSLYDMWSQHQRWSDTPLTLKDEEDDQGLINGATLRNTGRYPAVDYWDNRGLSNYCIALQRDDCIVVAVCSKADNKIDEGRARLGAEMLFLGDEELQQKLSDTCILSETFHFSLSAYNSYFKNILYVIYPLGASIHPRNFPGPLCACGFFGLHAKCEHVYYIQGLDLLNLISASRDFRNMPFTRKRGRKVGPITSRGDQKSQRLVHRGAAKDDENEENDTGGDEHQEDVD